MLCVLPVLREDVAFDQLGGGAARQSCFAIVCRDQRSVVGPEENMEDVMDKSTETFGHERVDARGQHFKYLSP